MCEDTEKYYDNLTDFFENRKKDMVEAKVKPAATEKRIGKISNVSDLSQFTDSQANVNKNKKATLVTNRIIKKDESAERNDLEEMPDHSNRVKHEASTVPARNN